MLLFVLCFVLFSLYFNQNESETSEDEESDDEYDNPEYVTASETDTEDDEPTNRLANSKSVVAEESLMDNFMDLGDTNDSDINGKSAHEEAADETSGTVQSINVAGGRACERSVSGTNHCSQPVELSNDVRSSTQHLSSPLCSIPLRRIQILLCSAHINRKKERKKKKKEKFPTTSCKQLPVGQRPHIAS